MLLPRSFCRTRSVRMLFVLKSPLFFLSERVVLSVPRTGFGGRILATSQWVGHVSSLEVPFIQVVSEVVSQLEGAFALLIKSTHFPTELIAAKKGSPLLLGATLILHLPDGAHARTDSSCRAAMQAVWGAMIWRAHDHECTVRIAITAETHSAIPWKPDAQQGSSCR